MARNNDTHAAEYWSNPRLEPKWLRSVVVAVVVAEWSIIFKNQKNFKRFPFLIFLFFHDLFPCFFFLFSKFVMSFFHFSIFLFFVSSVFHLFSIFQSS